MAVLKLDTAQIIEISKKAKELGINSELPSSKPGVADKAEREKWEFDMVPGKGGRHGMKKLYTIPAHLVDKLEEKGLLNLFNLPEGWTDDMATTDLVPSEKHIYKHKEPTAAANGVPDGMADLVQTYRAWAAQQDTGSIVPVRYHINVFGSAGGGSIAWNAEETEAMWFRASFFRHLGVNPDRCFCTRVKGDSMFPTLIDLGTVLWCATNRYTEEGIYLFRQYDEIRIKRLQRLNAHTFNIISDNANKGIYPTTELDLSQATPHDFEILGRYLWSCGISK